MITKKNPSLLQGMPEKEADFLIENAVKIARQSDGSLENILQGIADFRKDLGYGWEEAVLTQIWYRWPSEIQNQIFCSEKALTSYLLLKTLGIKARYAVLPDYVGSGMNHEVVLVQKDDNFLMLDWEQVLPTKLDGNEVKVGKYTYDDVLWIPDDEVIPRVLASRSGERFMDAIKCGQMLYRKKTREGEIDAYIKYTEEKGELRLLYIYRPSAGISPFYFDQRFIAAFGDIAHQCNIGILTEDNGLNSTGLDYLDRKADAIGMLDEEQIQDLKLFVMYDALTESRDGEEFFLPEEERAEKLEHYRKQAEEEGDELAQGFGQIPILYDEVLKREGKHYADKFLDFQLFRIACMVYYEHQEDFDRVFIQNTEIRNNYHLQLSHIAVCAREMAKVMAYDTSLECHSLLCRELAARTGQPYNGIEPAACLNVLNVFQVDDKPLWTSKELSNT